MNGDFVALNLKTGRRFQMPKVNWEHKPAHADTSYPGIAGGVMVSRRALHSDIEAHSRPVHARLEDPQLCGGRLHSRDDQRETEGAQIASSHGAFAHFFGIF